MPKIRVSIISVTYNNEDLIENFISSVLKNISKNDGLIIVDNHSSDKTVEKISKFKNVTLVLSDKNLGFSKGNNLGVKAASGQYLFFLNPDTQMNNPILDQLIDFYEDVDAGIVGPKLIKADGQIQASVRKLPTWWGAFKEYILNIKESYSEYVPSSSSPMEVETVYGAAMLIRKDLFDKIGGFDEKFFLYYEDIDLCNRVRELGKKIYYFPQVSIKHLVGGSKSNIERSEVMRQSQYLYHGLLVGILLDLIFQFQRLRRKLHLI